MAQYQTNMANDKGRLVGNEAAVIAEALRHYGLTERSQLIVNKYQTGAVGIRPRKGIRDWLWYVAV